MKDKNYNQNIDCDVTNCKYCDCSNSKCKLPSIKVVSLNDEAKLALETACANFKKR